MASKTNRTLRVFAAASFLNDLGSDIIYPLWPLFVTSLPGANVAVLGLIDGLGDALVSISQAAAGFISDRVRKRKVFVWVGYVFGGLSRAGYAVSFSWQWLVPFRILDRGGKMRDTPRDVIMVDAAASGGRGKNFGILRTFDNLGAVCGIIIAMSLVGVLGFRQLFLLGSIPSLIAALLVYRFIKDPAAADKKIFKGFSIKQTSRQFRLLLAASAFFALGSFSYSFLIVFANRSGIGTTFVPALYLLFTLVASLTSLQFGRLSDKLKSRKAIMFASFLLWMAVCLTLILSQSVAAIIFAFVVYGLHRGSLDTIQNVFVAEMAPPQFKASSLGLFQLAIGLCALPASLGAGILWSRLGDLAPFKLSLGLTLVALVMLLFVREQKPVFVKSN